MTEEEERAHEQGRRTVATSLLMQCARELGHDDPLRRAAVLIAEREATVIALRDICKDHGDNDWPDALHLADVIEKHLVRHLGSSK